jgi:hypothetical protein
VDFLEDGAAGADLQARAAIFLRDQNREIARVGQGLHEFGRVGHCAVEFAPVVAGKTLAELGDRVANVLMVVVDGVRLGADGNVHGVSPFVSKAIARPRGPGYCEKAGVRNRP